MPNVQPEQCVLYVVFTVAFLILVWFIHRQTRPLGTNLVLSGILVVVLACGYGLIGAPSLMMVTPTLTKIGFLVVLGGLVWSLLSAYPGTVAAKEANHV